MANIIDTSYFVEDIELPNVGQPEITQKVTNSIKTYEKEVLIDLLGYPLYKELTGAVYVDGDASKWDKLVNGEEFSFVVNGLTITTKWEGLKGFEKKSLIAYFVYFMHRRKEATYMAGVGTENKADTENSSMDDLHPKLTYIWNEFLKMYGDGYFNHGAAVADGTHENEDPSAFNYLLAKKSDFTNWRFVCQGDELNRFGI